MGVRAVSVSPGKPLTCGPSSGACQLSSPYSPGIYSPTSEPILLCFPDHTHLLPVPPLFSLFHSPPRVSETCCEPTDQAEADGHTHPHTRTHLEVLSANMGQILSWIRGPQDGPALQDVAVEEQVCENVSVCLCVCA